MVATGRIRCPSPLAMIGGVIVFATLAFLNLDGYHDEPFGPGGFYEEPPDINWTHGWPLACIGRTSRGTGPLVVASVQRTITSRWPFDGTPFTYVYRARLYADGAILVASIVATMWSINSLTQGVTRRLSFGMKTLFGVMSVTAVALIARPYLADRIIQYRFAITVLTLAGVTVICAIIQQGVRLFRQSLSARS